MTRYSRHSVTRYKLSYIYCYEKPLEIFVYINVGVSEVIVQRPLFRANLQNAFSLRLRSYIAKLSWSPVPTSWICPSWSYSNNIFRASVEDIKTGAAWTGTVPAGGPCSKCRNGRHYYGPLFASSFVDFPFYVS